MEITFDGGKVVTAHTNNHVIKTDQPERAGGGDTAPSPYELFLASIGTCAGIYVKSFCDQRGLPTDHVKIVQSMEYDRQRGVPGVIKLDIQVPDDFPDKYKAALINAAGLCAVKKTISDPPQFEVVATTPAER